MYCKWSICGTYKLSKIVLIVAKCIVNINIEGDRVTFVPVLIVAKCIVNQS